MRKKLKSPTLLVPGRMEHKGKIIPLNCSRVVSISGLSIESEHENDRPGWVAEMEFELGYITSDKQMSAPHWGFGS